MIGSTEIIIIAAVAVVLFGSTAIPKFARSLGKVRKEFKEGLKEGKEGIEETTETAEKKLSSETTDKTG